jgi:hypothetical protein
MSWRNSKSTLTIGIICFALTFPVTATDDALVRSLLVMNINKRLVENCGVGKNSGYHRHLTTTLSAAEGHASPEDVGGVRATISKMTLGCGQGSIHVRRLRDAIAKYEADRDEIRAND